MDTTDIVGWIEVERLGLADVLDDLSAAEWAAGSLCTGWTVRDVVAHLTFATRVTPVAAVMGMIKARGDLNRMIDTAARERARRFEPAELVAQLRESAGSTRRPPGTTPAAPFVDVLVHGQDIVRPLGRRRAMPVEQLGPVLDHVWTSKLYGARARFAGLRFVATDVEWAEGDGPLEVRGPVTELLLVSTGRAAGLAGLHGAGVALARRRVG